MHRRQDLHRWTWGVDGNFIHQQKEDRMKLTVLFSPFSNPRFKPRMPWGWYFSDFFGKGSQIGTQASTGVLGCIVDWVATMGSERENFYCLWVTQCLNEQCPFLCLMWRKFWASKSWKNSSIVFIVLIVLIVTQCLNDAMSFSLFNATQFLSIEIRGNPDVVFIVLIVFIVTWYLNEAMPFLLLLWCRFCTLKNKKQTKRCGTLLLLRFEWFALLSIILIYTVRKHLTFHTFMWK